MRLLLAQLLGGNASPIKQCDAHYNYAPKLWLYIPEYTLHGIRTTAVHILVKLHSQSSLFPANFICRARMFTIVDAII